VPAHWPWLDVRQPKSNNQVPSYSENELVNAVSTHLGVTSESAATAIERLFKDRGRPVGYITGEEGGGALTIGARYGKGILWMKDGRTQNIFWSLHWYMVYKTRIISFNAFRALTDRRIF